MTHNSQLFGSSSKLLPPNSKLILCHLGSGCSVTAVKNGKSFDTSMGFTPMDGLIMTTRSGEIDPGVVIEMCKKYGVEKTEKILNHESGLEALTGTSDMRKIIKKAKSGNKKCKFAIDSFVKRVQEYINKYIFEMKGCDLIVFSGGIGEGSAYIRKLIMKDFKNIQATVVKVDEMEEMYHSIK